MVTTTIGEWVSNLSKRIDMLEDVQFNIKIAGLVVRMNSRYKTLCDFCADYLTEEENFDITASVSESEIDGEMGAYETPFSRQYCENVCLYRSIAEQLPELDRFVFHGAAVKAFEKAYIFTAPSGTGKTTHVRLLTEFFGDHVSIINGDKPIIKVQNGSATVYSTPWAGKERWQTNTSADLGGIILLKRGKVNSIRQISPAEYFNELIKQVYIPKKGEMMLKTLDLVDALAKLVPFYLLECDMTEEAAKTSFGVMK